MMINLPYSPVHASVSDPAVPAAAPTRRSAVHLHRCVTQNAAPLVIGPFTEMVLITLQ